ncbi:Trk system potassium transporter TrkA [bacterium]|nr:Trk system potassium transporter TrkA [bacterium]
MKVLIIGAGETGHYIASELSEDDFKVSVIDENPEQLKVIRRNLNVAGFLGNGTSLSLLESAGIESTDLIIASTNHDETNLICCLLANHYKVKHKIAVTKTESFMKKKLVSNYLRSGISQVINSTMVTVQEILDTASLASAIEVSAFGEKSVLLVGCRIRESSPWKGVYLKDIRQTQTENQFLIASIVRDGQSSIPSGQDQIRQGDYVYILIPRHLAHALNDILKVRISTNRRAVIAGGNLIAEKVALGLAKSHFEVILICRNESNVNRLQKRVGNKSQITIRHGDYNSVKEQLKSEVSISSLFIAVSGDDRQNLAAGMVARYLGATKVIAIINRQDMLQCAELVDIDVTISPRLSTARQIKKIVRGREQSLNYTTISETNMEVMEMVTNENSRIINTPLKEVKLPENTLVGAIIKEEEQVIIPTGDTIINAGDKVIMVTMPESVPKLRTIIEGK